MLIKNTSLAEKILSYFILLFALSLIFNFLFPDNFLAPLTFVFACCGFIMLFVVWLRAKIKKSD